MEKVEELAADTATAGQMLREPEPRWDEIRSQLVEPMIWLNGLTETDKIAIEPFLLANAFEAVTSIWVALEQHDRRTARLAVERLRQTLNDIAEAAEVGATRDPAEVVAWIDERFPHAPAAELGELVGVSGRTWQRWASGDTEPRGRQGEQVRALAQVLAHLRHAYSPAGCLAWLERPHPALGGSTPAELLADPTRTRQVIDLAAGSRIQTAA